MEDISDEELHLEIINTKTTKFKEKRFQR